MMKKIFCLIALLTAFVSVMELKAQKVVSATLSKDTILIGDQIEWSTKIKVPQNLSVKIDSFANEVTPGVEIVGKFGLDTLSMKKNMAEIDAKAILTSFDSGSYVIPSYVIYILDGDNVVDTLQAGAVNLEVTTIPIDTATYEMYDIKPQFTYPVTFKELLPWIGGVLLLVVIIYLIVRLIRNRKENKTLFGKPIVKDPPHITALRSLDKIRGEKLWQNNKEKQYYTAITETLRQYIEGRFNVQTMEKTSNEILESLEHEKIAPVEFEDLKELFEVADLVKFAKYVAGAETNEKAIPTAVRFVNATFLQEIEEEKNNG